MYSQQEMRARLNLSLERIPPGRPDRPGALIAPDHVTIFGAGDDLSAAPGAAAAAAAHARGVAGAADAAWLFTVDDRRALGRLAVDETGREARGADARGIGVKICGRRGIDQPAANARAALLTAVLLRRIGQGLDRAAPHRRWSAAACPAAFARDWQEFRAMVADRLDRLPGALELDLAPMLPAGPRPAFPDRGKRS
ncbi:hypothetical protein ACQ5SO_16190 [Rhodovulum sp. DZ06]|uniref:hypothetical protein n=1 Tax=Rhodovulum sp. DZ06 TaxID=3425126 RepID=UPI003D32B832